MVLWRFLILAALLAPLPATAAVQWEVDQAKFDALPPDDLDAARALIDGELAACRTAHPGAAECLELIVTRARLSTEDDPALSDRLADEALRIVGRETPPDPLATAAALDIQADLRIAAGRTAEGEALARRALALSETTGDAFAIIARQQRLAELLDQANRPAEAEALHRRAIAGLDALDPAEPDAQWRAYRTLAVNLMNQQRDAEAESWLRRAGDVIRARSGPLDPFYATILSDLGNLALRQERCSDAETLYLQAIDIWARDAAAKGGEDWFVESSYAALAGCYQATGRMTQAEAMLRRAVAALESAGPDQVAALANAYASLAVNLQYQGRSNEAEAMMRRVIAMLSGPGMAPGDGLALAYGHLGAFLDQQDRRAEAEPLHRQAVALMEQALGPDHPLTGDRYMALADNLARQGKAAIAERYYRRGHATALRLTIDDPRRIMAGWRLALVVDDPAEARTVLRRAIAGVLRRLDENGGYDGASQAEMARYAPMFRSQIGLAWSLGALTGVQNGK